MRRRVFALCPLLLLAVVRSAGAEPDLFPFVLPWDDARPGVTNLSDWLPKPAGKLGPITAGADGHFYAGKDRVRFFGVNLCFGGNFPRKEDAEKVAARMAKFGINAVRSHHLEARPFPDGILARGVRHTRDLDPEALDRLDYLIAQLQRHGIYANLNLLVSRPFDQADGLPADILRVSPKDRHVVGFFHKPVLELQKEYARKLLTHRNPYTNRTYAEDPAVAFVEINNENGLIHGWLGNQVDSLPEVFLRDLAQQWNAWLRQRYGTTDKLRTAWGARIDPPGRELFANADFTKGTDRWNLERHDKAVATMDVDKDGPPKLTPRAKAVRITVTQPGSAAWHVQFNQAGLKVEAGRPYTLAFWARADRALDVSVNLGQARDPWQTLGLQVPLRLTTEWKPFRFVVQPSEKDDNARVSFSDLSRQPATVWLAGLSFRPGGAAGLSPEERLENGTMPLFAHARFGERTPEGQRDWLRFLWETEDAYWQTMQRYLKQELHVRGVVIGTIVGCSTPNLMARLDAVDSHAYWQHPHFPGREWDPDNWTVGNVSMVNEPGGVLPSLARRRVEGKPHCVTEYNHPAPNTFGSEGFLLLAAYGALQDWDAIFPFSYCHRTDRWDTGYFDSFFDIDRHPTKMATLPAAVALFVRGDVQPAREQVLAPLGTGQEIDALRTAHAWELVNARQAGVPGEVSLVHRVALATGSDKPKPDVPSVTGPRLVSDTGELIWDRSEKGRGVVTVNTARSKAVIGYVGGKRFELGGVVIEPDRTMQDGWSVVTLTAREGELARGPARLFVTATGHVENTAMGWKSAVRDSVGHDWGRAPSLVEGVPARITLPRPAAGTKAWVLDERGQRKGPLSVEGDAKGQAVLKLGPQSHTLWYEIECE
jgi:hypothetical protein